MKAKKYFIGLDIGTESVGYAVTDLEYNLSRMIGKDAWGVRLFGEAETAEQRRAFRTSRRRLERRKLRISLLQDIFSDEIMKVDEGFYQRLNESFYHKEDKALVQPYSLFNDKDFNDKSYYIKYPTIFHLRNALLNEDISDIRLLYLAVAHIIKYRGHFLFEGQELGTTLSVDEPLGKLNNYLSDNFGSSGFSLNDISHLEKVVLEDKISINAKKKKFEEILIPTTKQEKAFIAAMVGGSVSVKDLLSFDEDSEIKNIKFSDSAFEENTLPKLEQSLDEDNFAIIELLKSIYDWTVLSKILAGEKYISSALVGRYQKHQNDLKRLKTLVKNYYGKEEYRKIFRSDKLYSSYVGFKKISGNKQSVKKYAKEEDFFKELKKILEGKKEQLSDNIEYSCILSEIENRTFLPKQVVKNNSVIPYQVNKSELVDILDKASSRFAFLNEVSDGLSNKEKIISLLEFRIPYYIGPLNGTHSEKFAWVERLSKGKVTPWNFNEKIDVSKSAEEFIKRMTNKCTYLWSSDVLPKNSIIYSAFTVLNEINKMKIHSENISSELKQGIFINVFLKFKKPTVNRIKDYLVYEGIIKKEEKKTIEITGIDTEIKSSMAKYVEFASVFNVGILNDAQLKIAEDVVLWNTLFSDKKLARKRVREVYPGLSQEIVNQLVKINCSGWGSLSQKLIIGIEGVNKETGELASIMSNMWNYNINLMELMSNKYDYVDKIATINREKFGAKSFLDYSDVEKLPCSPSVKRQVWQALEVVAEIKKLKKNDPEKVFIEMARGGGEKGKRTLSRKKQLLDLYENCVDEERDWVNEIDGKEDRAYQSDTLYLYYIQKGRCMYSGEIIHLEELFNRNVYDIDHIYPQSKVKDDSLNNRVLVKKTFNMEKSDIYPISSDIRDKMSGFWYGLYKSGLIAKSKYERLTRSTPLSNDELADFIDRQLVETRQSTKYVAELLKTALPKSQIVYVKAGNVSDFRHEFKLTKVREINDLHHAKDAYLNIVVGNVFETKFGYNARMFFQKQDNAYNLRRMYDFDVKKGEYYAWIADGENLSKNKVASIMAKNTPLVSKLTVTGKGALFNQTLQKAKDGLIPIKSSNNKLCNTSKYGGYTSLKTAYFCIIEVDDKKNSRKKVFETIPVLYKDDIESGKITQKEYFEKMGYSNVVIINAKIKIGTLFSINGAKLRISGVMSGGRITFNNANQLILDAASEAYVKKVSKVVIKNDELVKFKKLYNIDQRDGITQELNIDIMLQLSNKLKNPPYCNIKSFTVINKMDKIMEEFITKDLLEQCQTIMQMLKILSCNAQMADLSNVGATKSEGNVYYSKNIDSNSNIYIIYQSKTGLFEKKIKV